ncbi:MAG: ATP phosphoribosyltransferase, partial [Nanoarchaeota archaeon]
MKIKLGIPKGSLQEATMKLFKKAGFNISVSERSYKPIINDEEIECLLIRAQEIPKYVEQGVLDVGLTGKDWIMETNADVEEISELLYTKQGLKKVRLVIAVSETSDINSIKDLEGKRIATELVNVTKSFLKKNKINAEVEFSWGATEVKVPELVDAIAELTETGASLKANNLKIIETILESTTRFIANKKAIKDPEKKRKIEDIAL